ncbi:type II toxin-antitoxin system RelE/ParE family toxin [Falsiroseomonas sp. HC035]|uniref:type II toxin-antitoxin system RelE/ParE family toxin n=1 Tax=Falsiroseomonas sp. HC035 TaxID=3390999 RepID=UPI003D30FFBF
MKRLRVTLLARRDLAEAIEDIARDNRESAMRLRNRLPDAGQRLAAFPGMGRSNERGRRLFAVPAHLSC